jgi:hypothetical protein
VKLKEKKTKTVTLRTTETVFAFLETTANIYGFTVSDVAHNCLNAIASMVANLKTKKGKRVANKMFGTFSEKHK